jgi:predicted CXXCH cytochrome family protein
LFNTLWVIALGLLMPSLLHAETEIKDPEFCLECHSDLTKVKVVHKAITDACMDCHTNMDGTKTPHQYTGKFRFGLGSEEPKLCLSCHAKVVAKKINTHKAIERGCTVCHDPHSSRHKKLLKATVSTLCQSCHDKKNFAGTVNHAPVKEGKCNSCHNTHASDNPFLLHKPPAESCLECHKEIKDQPHVVSGFTRKSHPLGNEAEQSPDPLRPGKTFYCGSCHEPHKSDFPKLVRLDPKMGTMACQKCHEK